MKAAMHSDVISWPCDACGDPVDDGYIHISHAAIRVAEEAHARWEREHPGPMYSGAELAAAPLRAAWQLHHASCDPYPESDDYWIEVEGIRTAVGVLDWSVHLGGKGWIGVTNWPTIQRRALRALAAAHRPAQAEEEAA